MAESEVELKSLLMKVKVQFSSAQSLSRVRLFATPWITARQASLSITNSQSSLRLTSIVSVMPSSHLILCGPLLLLPPVPPSIRVFSNESALNKWGPSTSRPPSLDVDTWQGWGPRWVWKQVWVQSCRIWALHTRSDINKTDAHTGTSPLGSYNSCVTQDIRLTLSPTH